MFKKLLFLFLALLILVVVLTSCAVDAETRGRRAVDNLIAAVAGGKVENIEITVGELSLTLGDLSDAEKTELVNIIQETRYKRSLKKNVESPGTSDGGIRITLVDRIESIGCYGYFVSWLYSAEYGWYIAITNESLSRWMQDYVEKKRN
jgi:hypothetical protein